MTKKPRAAKVAKPKPAKATKPKKGSKVRATKFNSPVNEEDRALFLNHLPKIADLKAKIATATANYRNALKTAKSDGFLKSDFDTAFLIQGAEGEKAKKAAIARDLTIAKWLGCDLGSQLDLFVEDERVPATDRAFDLGKMASMQNKAANPPFDPATDQYRQFMAGFHEHQATLAKGIKPTNSAVKADVKATAEQKATSDQQRAQDAKAFEQPESGTPISREQYKEMQAKESGKGDTLPH